MLQILQTPKPTRIKASSPSIIEIDNGVTIHIDFHGNVSIEGHKKLAITCEDDIALDAKNIDIRAKETVYIGSGKGNEIQGPVLHLNKNKGASGYEKE